jgi:hypothetical protein
MVIKVDGDLYVLRFPRIHGEAQPVISRQFIKAPEVGKDMPPIFNVLRLIEDLTPAKAATLSEDTLRSISADFELGLHALYALEASQGQDLIRIACGDIEMAVNNLMDRAQRNGEAKWASLQAAEKVLKAALALEGAEFEKSHGLSRLSEKLHDLGIQFNSKPLTDVIQCKPGIRYGDETCTRDEALAAHRASLQLVLELINAGAKLRPGLG